MAGSKRRAGGDSSAKAASAAAVSASSSSSSTLSSELVIYTVVHHLTELSQFKPRCSEALQAFADGKCRLDAHAADTAEAGGTTPTTTTTSISSSSSKKKTAPSSSSSTALTLAAVAPTSTLDCYWIVLATHVMNRVLHQLIPSTPAAASTSTSTASTAFLASVKKHPTQEEVESAIVLSHLAHRLATILVVDKGRLEKACCATTTASPSRSLVGRAVLTSTVSGIWSLQVLAAYTPPPTENESSSSSSSASTAVVHSAIVAATIALDRLVHLNVHGSATSGNPYHASSSSNSSPPKYSTGTSAAGGSSSPTSGGGGMVRKGRSPYYLQEPVWDDDDTAQGDWKALCCRVAETGTPATPEELACLAILHPPSSAAIAAAAVTTTVSADAAPEEPPAKRVSRRSARPKSKKQQAAQQRKEQQQQSPSTSPGSASSNLPKVFASLIQSAGTGIRMDGRVAVKRWASMALVWLCQGQARLLHTAHTLLSQDIIADPEGVDTSSSSSSSWLAQSTTITCRLLSIISESGNHCGLRPPTGGMDQYVRAIMKDTRKKIKLVRVDIRDWATVVIYQLIQRHGQRLESLAVAAASVGASDATTGRNRRSSSTIHHRRRRIMVVNDEEDSSSSLLSSSSLGEGGYGHDRKEEESGGVGGRHSKQSHHHIGGDMSSSSDGHLSEGGSSLAARSSSSSLASSSSSSLECCPNLSKVLTQLCRSAAASVGSSSYTDQSEWVKRLMSMAAAFSLQLACRPSCPLDCKLTNFAISYLTDALRNLEHSGTTTPTGRGEGVVDDEEDEDEEEEESNPHDGWMVQKFQLETPLPIPQVPNMNSNGAATSAPTKARGKKKQAPPTEPSSSPAAAGSFSLMDDVFAFPFATSMACTYAGMFPPKTDSTLTSSTVAGRLLQSAQFSDEDVVALVLRATAGSSSSSMDPTSSPAASLLSTLTEIVRRAYDTRTPKQTPVSDQEHSRNASSNNKKSNHNDADGGGGKTKSKGSRKRTATRGGDDGGSRRKRAKTSAKNDMTKASLDGVGSEEDPTNNDDSNQLQWNRITAPRAQVATEALNALRFCLIIQHPKPSSTLRQWIRKSLTTEHIGDLIELGEWLDRIVVKTRSEVHATVPNTMDLTERLLLQQQQAPSAATVPSSTSLFPSTATTAGAGSSSNNNHHNSYDFTHHEKSLWSAHMNMCIVLGGGQLIFEGSSVLQSMTDDVPPKRCILGDAERRRIIYMSASASHGGGASIHSQDASEEHPKGILWPLWLPAAQYALVASNLITEPLPTIKDEMAPERFIVQNFVESIGDVLMNMDARIKAKNNLDDDKLYLDDELPLSLRDARLFLLAFSRLPLEDKRYCFDELVTILSNAFQNKKELTAPEKGKRRKKGSASGNSITGGGDKGKKMERASLADNSEASSFVARVLVTCSSMIHLIKGGERLRDMIVMLVGGGNSGSSSGVRQMTLPVPSFVPASEWYRSERCFMGVFSDWEAPGMPPDSNSSSANSSSSSVMGMSTGGLKDSTIEEWKSVLQICFSLGFASAQRDQCHLLFAAWNGLGNASFLGRFSPLGAIGGSDFPKLIGNLNKGNSNEEEEDVLSQRILQLRDDVCSVHGDINQGSSGDAPRSSTVSSSRIKTNLRSMITKAEDLMDSVLAKHATAQIMDDDEPMGSVAGDSDETIPAAVFSLLASIPTYISSSVAAHTKPGNDYFSTTLSKEGDAQRSAKSATRRQRGYSSESDPDGDSVETDGGGGGFETDARVDALSRLRECCDAFGAAPIHPDWLDVSCHLREGISSSDAAETAEMALRTLTRLIVTALTQYKWHQFQAIKCYHAADESLDKRAALSLNLCQWSSHEPGAISMLGPDPYPDDREWKDDIATACGLNPEALELILDDAVVRNMEQSKEAWCPNAAQRLVGRLHERNRLIGGWETSTAELRAGGEWELLLSEALTTSCLDVARLPDATAEKVTADRESAIQKGHAALVTAQRWRNVCMAAASHLMPAASLLRLGLGQVGRKPHPFSFHDNNQDPYDVAPLHFSERLSGTLKPSSSLKKVVFETLGALTRLCVEGDDALTASCHAIASHLVVDSKSFSDLEGLQAIRFSFIGLSRLRSLVTAGSQTDKVNNVVPFIVERLTSVIEDYGRIPKTKTSSVVETSDEFRRLLEFFGAHRTNLLDTIVDNDVEAFTVLTTGDVEEVVDSGAVSYHWKAKQKQSLAISEFVSVMCRDSLRANRKTRACIALMLSRVADLESHPKEGTPSTVVVRALVAAFNSIEKEEFRGFLLSDLCSLSPVDLSTLEEKADETFRKDIGIILEFLLAYRSKSVSFEKSKFVLDVLLGSFNFWSKLEPSVRDPAFDILFFYSCYFDSLKDIGDRLVASTSSAMAEDSSEGLNVLEPVTKFLGFVRDLRSALSSSPKEQRGSNRSTRRAGPEASKQGTASSTAAQQSTKDAQPLSCSFVLKSGFHGQHWYNCYTCGLVWDKGCCTLCALVCHKGHDVSYSRYSSFFCDCGAEDRSATERNRVACKCLSALPSDQVESIFDGESKVASAGSSNLVQSQDGDSKPESKSSLEVDKTGIEIARNAFRAEALSAIDHFSDHARRSMWAEALFGIVRVQFESWKKVNSTKSMLQSLLLEGKADPDGEPKKLLSHEALRRNLRSRRAKALDLQGLSEKTIVPVRAAKGFQVKMSSDSSANARLVAQLAKHEISRAVVAADSRGRIVVAEPCSLVFCSAMPAVSVRYINRPFEAPLSRHHMCVLGSSTMKFNIVGLSLCRANERHVVVWGASEACVSIIKPNWDGVEEKIDLVFDLDQQDGETDYLVKCEWIPGSQTHVAVCCGRFVRIYDIARSDSDKRALPVIGYNLGFEAALRDLSIVPYKGYTDTKEDQSETGNDQDKISKLFLLLENGRLHVVDLKTGSNGKLESPGDQHFEPSECVVLGTSGVRARAGSPLGQPGSTSHSLGEGSRLAHLKQSRLLLYKCATSCVLALMLGTKGEVEGSFELLPHSISSDTLGNGPDGYSVTGPFTHWVELGVAYRKGAAFFRVACVGKSSRTHQPKILCLEFNESAVNVKEIAWSAGSSMGLGLTLSLSFEGLASLSGPFFCSSPDEAISFGERAFLCAVTSNGSLLFFGEEDVDTMPTSESATLDSGLSGLVKKKAVATLAALGGMQHKKPTFPLTVFEKLKNVSDSNDVLFGGDGIGSDPEDLKTRLSRDSSVFLMCPRREGCTLTVSLKPKRSEVGDTNKTNDSAASTQNGDLFIAAIRILVGSTSSDCIPSKIFIQGRPVDLTPGVKKWYSLPLTEEEIALSIRNGLVSVGIGPSFESSHNPLVDSVEVYAAERDTIQEWLPRAYFSLGRESDLATSKQRSVRGTAGEVSESPNGLILSARALTHLGELLGSGKIVGSEAFLKHLVQDTALDRDKRVSECVVGLLERLESDSRVRKFIYDESILIGCSKVLSRAREWEMDADGDDSANPTAKWNAVKLLLHDCLESAAAIARERPMNYLQSVQNIVEKDVSSGSIAVDASKLVIEGLRRSALYEGLIGGPGGIVDLALTEMAIDLNTDTTQSKHFAKFDVIRSLLESSKSSVVERCCEAVSTFCRNHVGGERALNDRPDLFTLLQHARLVAYQCDSCAVMPMKEIRYTLLEEDHDIDLCKDCFRLGKEYAELKRFSAKVAVVINGKAVGGETRLTCAQMRQMQPVSLEKMDVEQVEVQSTGKQVSPPSDASVEDDENLQKALRLSLGENIEEDHRDRDLPIGNQAYEDFAAHLFSSLVELLSTVLKRDRCGPQVGPLIRLLLDGVRDSRREESKVERAKRFAKELAVGVSHLLKSGAGNKKLPQDKVLALVTCLRALSNLLFPEADSHYFLAGSHPDEHAEEQKQSKTKGKMNPKFVCEVHNVPAVRRRCARGIHKDRRFYVCGKGRGSRCKYFVWADEFEDKEISKVPEKSNFNDVVQGFLWSHFSAGNVPLHARLCRLLEDEVFGDESDECDATLSLNASTSDKKTETTQLTSFYGQLDAERDLADGVFCCREKLQDVVSGERVVRANAEGNRNLVLSVGSSVDRGALLLESSLDLLTLISDHQTEGISRWFSLLCEINVSSSKPASLRSLAKKVLKTMCGGKRSLYHSVRDHFAFGFQIKSLFRNSSRVLEAALVVKEKARQCGPRWASDDRVGLTNLGVGDLIGTQELVSEDAHSQICGTKIGKVLDELWGVIKNRGESWRKFCGLSSLPHSHRERKKSDLDNREGEMTLAAAAPIVSLFWVACCLTGNNQVKMLRLVDFALTNWKERKSAHGKSEGSSSDAEIAGIADDDEELVSMSDGVVSVPEDLLLSGENRLTVDGIVGFAMQFVYGGRAVELRRVACHIVVKLCYKLSPADVGCVFQRLVGPPLGEIGDMGKTCIEFLNLLQSLARLVDASAPVADAADLVMSFFMQQMNAVKFDRSNGEWAVVGVGSGSATMKKRFDLADCVYCLRAHLPASKGDSHGKHAEKRDSNNPGRAARGGSSGAGAAGNSRSAPSGSTTRSQTEKKWHPDQVCPYVRGRLDGGKESSASNEFCSFYTLKYRLSISEVHLTVNDPRGRFVKTITIYFSPRPVSDVSVLKSEDYSDNWQPCATMNLTRGTSRASASLSLPIVAANLKVEFTDFFERPGGSKASDGSLLVHCPRCTRVVTNAHGVCGNCGEVAFQCRKCRHINYDRLDAFLCVECGYCASGNFSLELTAGVASNAVAISNDEDYGRIVKILGATTSIHEDLKNALKERIRGVGARKKSKPKDDLDALFNPALKQAFLGLPPIPGKTRDMHDEGSAVEHVEKQGSVVKFVARPESSSASSRSAVAVDRTRSLLRLARQIRSESGSSSDRRRSSDVIIRHLGRGLAIDHLDDESDLIGLLEGGSVLDSSDSLSRVMATVQSRRRGESDRNSGGDGSRGQEGAPTSARKVETPREIVADCERLHLLMREAEREAYELNRRVEAWRRLESDTLADAGALIPMPIAFSPSHCSVCGGAVALQLLVLWLRLFQTRPQEVHVDQDFLCLLLEDFPSSSKALFDHKRQVVQEIATKSEDGAKLVLAELRKRLSATRDVACSEILGKIMEVEGFSMSEEYTKLAMEVLSASQGSR